MLPELYEYSLSILTSQELGGIQDNFATGNECHSRYTPISLNIANRGICILFRHTADVTTIIVDITTLIIKPCVSHPEATPACVVGDLERTEAVSREQARAGGNPPVKTHTEAGVHSWVPDTDT